MDFKLVYHSQKDKRWENDALGFGTGTYDTIGWNGCALTSVAMLLSGYGFMITPQDLNQKLKGVNGFAGSGIKWQAVPLVCSQIKLAADPYANTGGAPLDKINATLDAGRPVIVRVDTKPSEDPNKPDDHYVMLFLRSGNNDYLMLDPYPYQTDVTKPQSVMTRYGFGRPLNQVIERAVFYEFAGYSGHIDSTFTPVQPQPSPAPQPQPGPGPAPSPAPAPVPTDGVYARVLASVSSLAIRSTKDTSSSSNVIESVPAGTLLRLPDPQQVNRLGKPGKWVGVQTPKGADGFAEAQYLQRAK
jgi:uncharacterized protein YvpB